MQPKDYYKILGVAETATAEELKKAFRKIANESHPDKHPGDKAAEERFKEAGEAYDILGNPEKRKKYDALRKYGFSEAFGSGAGGGFGGQGFPGGPHIRFDTGNFQDMDFADIFSENSPFGDIFEQIFAQVGMAGGRTARGGRASGFRPSGFRPSPGPATQTLDPFFRQDGFDVHCTVWLKLDLLEKGAKVKVKTPSGKKVLLKIPAGTKIGSVFRVPGMGLPGPGKQGDQYVHVEAVE